MGNRGRAGQQRRSRVADLLTNIPPHTQGRYATYWEIRDDDPINKNGIRLMNTRKLCLGNFWDNSGKQCIRIYECEKPSFLRKWK